MKVPYFCVPLIRKQRSGCKDHVSDFEKHITKEYNEMKCYLPVSCNSILDIGCGLGGIDILLSKHYNNPKMYLFDKSIVDDRLIYGFDRGKCFYNSFEITRALLTVNDIKNYELIDAGKGFPDIKDIDLVVSLLSWGYHYKVEEYINEVYDCMSRKGVLIMDTREKTNGIQILKKMFKKVTIISTYNKSNRIYAEKG